MAEKKPIKVSEVSFKVSGTAFVLLVALAVGSCVITGSFNYIPPEVRQPLTLLAAIAGGALVVGIIATIWES